MARQAVADAEPRKIITAKNRPSNVTNTFSPTRRPSHCSAQPARDARPSRPPSLRGLGYEKAKAELCCVESKKVAAAFGPPT